MQINRPLLRLRSPLPLPVVASILVCASLLASGCVQQTAPPEKASTSATAPTAGTASIPPPASPAPEWRDAPLTPGEWVYRREGTATSAMFVSPQDQVLLSLTCHRERTSITIGRAGSGGGPVPATILTTYSAKPFSIAPAGPESNTLLLSLRANDPVLDEIAFSRGRFGLEVNGLPTLLLPARAEIGRVIEDCR